MASEKVISRIKLPNDGETYDIIPAQVIVECRDYTKDTELPQNK